MSVVKQQVGLSIGLGPGRCHVSYPRRKNRHAFLSSATMFHDMLHHPERSKYNLLSAQNIAYAGMAMTSALIMLCAEEFSPRHFINFYGSSEIFCFAVCDHVADKPGCAGRAGIGQMLRVVTPDPDGQSTPHDIVPDGQSGEIIAPMDGMEAFYRLLKRPDADAKSIRDGWYLPAISVTSTRMENYSWRGVLTTWLFRAVKIFIPKKWRIFCQSRLKLSRWQLSECPTSASMGARIVAFVEPASQGCSAETLDAWCLDSPLARFKRPRDYVFVKEIPRSAASKLLRRYLRDGAYQLNREFESTL